MQACTVVPCIVRGSDVRMRGAFTSWVTPGSTLTFSLVLTSRAAAAAARGGIDSNTIVAVLERHVVVTAELTEPWAERELPPVLLQVQVRLDEH
jgi:hypothetical protein